MITITNYYYDYDGYRHWFESKLLALRFMKINHPQLYDDWLIPTNVIKEVKTELGIAT